MSVAPPYPPPAHAPAKPRSGFRTLLPHLIWEGVLLLLVIVAAAAAAAQTELFSGRPWSTFAITGLLATALSLSLRTGTPNLAIGGQYVFGAVLFAKFTAGHLSPIVAGALAILVVALIGLVLGVIAGLTSVPAWAVSLGGLAALTGGTLAITESQVLTVRDAGPFANGGLWFAMFVLISLAGGALWLLPPIRRLGTVDRATDPVRFTGRRLLAALLGGTGSGLLAGLAGLVSVGWTQAIVPGSELTSLLLALAVVLLGGVSAFGGRGGVAGVVLATLLFGIANHWLLLEKAPYWASTLLPVALMIIVGVGVSRLIEAVAGPPAPPATSPGPGAGPYPAAAPYAPTPGDTPRGGTPVTP